MEKLTTYLRPYGIEPSSSTPLAGYISENYKITDVTGQKWLLKVYQDNSDIPLVKAENEVLQLLHQHGDVNASVPVANQDGQYLSTMADGTHCRLLSYIEGDFMEQKTMTAELLKDFGAKAARMDLILANAYQAEIAARRDKWNLSYLSLSKKDIDSIQEADQKKIVAYFIDQFEAQITDQIQSLRHSVIHNDLNDQNVLIADDKINGFIDFGDMAYSPLIYEVAIALTYIMMLSADPVADACTFIKAYHEVLPLQRVEIDRLYYLIAGRLCTSVISSAKAKAEGADTAYILISEKPAWKLIHYWLRMNPIGITYQFLQAASYPTDHPATKAKTRVERRHAYIPKAVKMSYKEPIQMQSAAFQYMYDIYGNTYLDAYNNIPLVGHCHPAVTAAISQQARTLNTNTRYHYDSLGEYAEQLLSLFPASLNRVFFVNSGSAASDLSIRLAQQYTGAQTIACIESGYHGNTQIGINVSPYKYAGKGGKGREEDIIELPLAKLYQGSCDTTVEYLTEAVCRIEKAKAAGKPLAGCIAESISGCGGQVAQAPGYLHGIQQYLKEDDVPLIMDEVQTGFGRVGSTYWAYELHNVLPDIVILGKPMGNGHPLAAVVCRKEIAEAFDNGMEFFSSFGGNPVSCAVGLAVLHVIEEEELQQQALQVGNYMKAQLEDLAMIHPAIGDVRGEGLFLGVELINPEGKADTAQAQYAKQYLKENYILTSTDGKYDNVLKIKPPLCFTYDNADEYCDVLEAALQRFPQVK